MKIPTNENLLKCLAGLVELEDRRHGLAADARRMREWQRVEATMEDPDIALRVEVDADRLVPVLWRDLPQLGVATFGQSRLPAQTPFWESATVPGIYFAGTIMQGSQGLRKHGIPSNSGAVQGYRYNARVLARHLAESRFDTRVERRGVRAEEVVPLLLAEVSRGPELWHQRSYLARVFTVGAEGGMRGRRCAPTRRRRPRISSRTRRQSSPGFAARTIGCAWSATF